MMSKKEFVEYMEKIRSWEQLSEELTNLYNKISSNNSLVNFYEEQISVVLKLLQDCLGLPKSALYGTDIDYFIYELNWGESHMAENCITDGKGKTYSLRNISQFADYLYEAHNLP